MKKILVVDDEPEVIELVQTRLEQNNFSVISAENGQEGIEKARDESPDLILMDIIMPNISGGDAVRVLKSDEKTKDIPIIFLTAVTGSTNSAGEEEGINVGGRYYPAIGKPFDADHLLVIINKHLS